jgi:glycosyltransferase involved in cell wall biosynthesis
MKVVLVSPAHPLRGGIAASSERLALELQHLGHTVVVYSFSLQYPAFLFPGKTQFSDDAPPGGLTIKTRLNAINPFNWVRTGREVARERPDLVITRFWLPFMAPSLGTTLRVARWFGKKPFRSLGLVDNIVPHEKRPGDRLLARYFVGACDAFVVMSQSVRLEIGTFTPKPVRFAPHPVYDTYGDAPDQTVARRELGLPEKAPLVLFFGFIRAYKGLDLLLEALALAPGVHALVAGESYDDWAPYQAIIDRHGLRERVHLFTHFIPNDGVKTYFAAADLVVQPYRTATQSGISQIAYHFNKPMVVTRVGGLPEIVADGTSGYVVDVDPAAIAAAVRDFFDNNRAATMAKGVEAEKARFAWKALVDALLGTEG